MKCSLLFALFLCLSTTVSAISSEEGDDSYRRYLLRTNDEDDESDDTLRSPAQIPETDVQPAQRITQREEKVYTDSELKRLFKKGYAMWKKFKQEHGKKYDNIDMEKERMKTFLINLEEIKVHNEKYSRGERTFEMGTNHIADLPFEEYKKLNGFRQSFGDSRPKNSSSFLRPHFTNVPTHVDWRDHGYVSEVKNQGMCGSCWAFSSTGALEGQHKRQKGELIELSEQNLIDCSRSYGNNGCNGGLMDYAFEYVKQNRGIDTEESYPYKGKEMRCHFKRRNIGAEDTGYVDLPEGDEEALQVAVATQGPISVAIDAGHRSFQLYKKGVYFERECSPENLDHGVLVVGYGTDESDGDYWIVKNSWSAKWGEEGYIRMARNKNNHCGIASKASYPLV